MKNALSFGILFLAASIVVHAQVTVSGSAGANGSYATLKSAFDAINANSNQTGNNIIITLSGSTTETATASLNGSATPWTTLTVYPTGSGYTVSGNLAAPLIDLNNCDHVTIDGRVNASGSTTDLTIINTNASNAMSTSTIRLYDEANHNTVKYCTILGSSTGSTGISPTTATVFFEGGPMNPGCSYNTIQNNNIGPAGSNLPTMAVASYAMGSTYANDNNSVNGNNIYDYYGSATSDGVGINLGDYTAEWTISNNRFYQTGNRSGLGNSQYLKSIYISNSWTGGFTVSGNIIGYANSSGTGMFTNNGGNFTGIEMTAIGSGKVSSIQGNTINGISWTTASNASAGGAAAFNGIIVIQEGVGVNIGTTSPNIIGAASGTGSPTTNIYVVSTTDGTGIIPLYVSSETTCTLQNTTIGAIATSGAASIGFSFYGIYLAGAGNYTVISNTIGNSNAGSISMGVTETTTATCNLFGIYSTSTGQITIGSPGAGNIIQNLSNNTNKSGTIQAIYNSGAITGTSGISYNSIDNLSFPATYTSATCYFINNTGAVSTSTLNITNNTFGPNSANYSGSAGGNSAAIIYGIFQAGTPLHVVISSNNFNNISTKTKGNIILISNTYTAPSNGSKTVQNNVITTGFNRTATGDDSHFYCYTGNGAGQASVTITISGNNFSNISCNTTGSWAGFKGIETTDGTGNNIILNVYNNVISNVTFNGEYYIYGLSLGCGTNTSGVKSLIYGNTISGITSSNSGNTYGIYIGGSNTDIYDNTIQNFQNTAYLSQCWGIWINSGPDINVYHNSVTGLHGGNSSDVYGIQVNNSSGTLSVYQNFINTLSSSGNVYGIYVWGGRTINIYQHQITAGQNYSIYGLSSTGTEKTANGITVAGGYAVNIFKNSIYNISNSSSGNTVPLVHGLLISAGGTVNASNNMIGNLTAPSANYTDAIRGISITSTNGTAYNIYYNTIYLNASSTNTNFGTTGIYHTTNSNAAYSPLSLRNTIIINKSTPKGTGKTVAYRRSSTDLANFASTSNNNIFYGGSPGPAKLIFYDGTNSDQTLAAYKARVAPRDANSFTEDVSFLSTIGSNANFLHINPAVYTQAESGAVNIATYTDDFDGNIRQGNGGYSGSGCAPDIGADEGEFTLDPSIDKTWNGQVSDIWHNAANWTPCGIPTLLTNVTIPSGTPNSCIIKAIGALSNNLLIKNGALLTLNVSTDITVGGNLTISAGGSLDNSGTANLKGNLDNQNP